MYYLFYLNTVATVINVININTVMHMLVYVSTRSGLKTLPYITLSCCLIYSTSMSALQLQLLSLSTIILLSGTLSK